MGTRTTNALQAVQAGAVRHAHPFTWGIDPPYWRPVHLTEAGTEALRKSTRG